MHDNFKDEFDMKLYLKTVISHHPEQKLYTVEKAALQKLDAFDTELQAWPASSDGR